MLTDDDLKNRGLITTGFHLPYNPNLRLKASLLRNNMTPAENKLWYNFLNTFRFRFLRQRPIDNYIVDFYCPSIKLALEIDGEQHYTNDGKEYDINRDNILSSYGLKTIRFSNYDVMNDFEKVCKIIDNAFYI